MRTPVVLSWSGGKDSALALHALRSDERFDVVALLTSVTREYDRISIHGVRRVLLAQQAEAIGLPVFEIELEPQSSNEAYEQAFLVGLAALRVMHPEVRHIAFGDLFLSDVRAYRERLLASTGIDPIVPLWGRDTGALAAEFVDLGFVAHLVCVDTEQLPADYTGRLFDAALLSALPTSADPCGERGEFHTFVSDGPIFSHSVSITVGDVVLRDNRFSYCDLLPALSESAKPPALSRPALEL